MMIYRFQDRARAWRDETARLFQESMEELRVEADTKCMQAVQAERDRLTNEMQTKVNQERQKSLEAVQSAIELSKSQYELQITQFKSEHSNELEQLKSKHHSEIDRLKAQFEEKLEQHDVSAQSEIEALRAVLFEHFITFVRYSESYSRYVSCRIWKTNNVRWRRRRSNTAAPCFDSTSNTNRSWKTL
jgi:chromosome segregation ATPase